LFHIGEEIPLASISIFPYASILFWVSKFAHTGQQIPRARTSYIAVIQVQQFSAPPTFDAMSSHHLPTPVAIPGSYPTTPTEETPAIPSEPNGSYFPSPDGSPTVIRASRSYLETTRSCSPARTQTPFSVAKRDCDLPKAGVQRPSGFQFSFSPGASGSGASMRSPTRTPTPMPARKSMTSTILLNPLGRRHEDDMDVSPLRPRKQNGLDTLVDEEVNPASTDFQGEASMGEQSSAHSLKLEIETRMKKLAIFGLRPPTPYPSKYATSPARLQRPRTVQDLGHGISPPQFTSLSRRKEKQIAPEHDQERMAWNKRQVTVDAMFGIHEDEFNEGERRHDYLHPRTQHLSASPVYRGLHEFGTATRSSSPNLPTPVTAIYNSPPSSPYEIIFPPLPTVPSPLHQRTLLHTPSPRESPVHRTEELEEGGGVPTPLSSASRFSKIPEYTGYTPSPGPRRRVVWGCSEEGGSLGVGAGAEEVPVVVEKEKRKKRVTRWVRGWVGKIRKGGGEGGLRRTERLGGQVGGDEEEGVEGVGEEEVGERGSERGIRWLKQNEDDDGEREGKRGFWKRWGRRLFGRGKGGNGQGRDGKHSAAYLNALGRQGWLPGATVSSLSVSTRAQGSGFDEVDVEGGEQLRRAITKGERRKLKAGVKIVGARKETKEKLSGRQLLPAWHPTELPTALDEDLNLTPNFCSSNLTPETITGLLSREHLDFDRPFILEIRSETLSTAISSLDSTMTTPNDAESASVGFVVYTTIITSFISHASPRPDIQPFVNATPTASTHPAWPSGHALSLDDVPENIRPDLARQDKEQFHKELIFGFGILAAAILVLWICSLCACWWRGDCFWNGIASDLRQQKLEWKTTNKKPKRPVKEGYCPANG
ncbi:hypothetical protein BU23DRAFT_664008, partial [Bimuria novae-zelandiae CBS 107.79]